MKEKKKLLEAIVSAQQISPEEKQRMQTRIATLQSEIQNLNDEQNIYQDEVYKVDIRLVGLRNAVSFDSLREMPFSTGKTGIIREYFNQYDPTSIIFLFFFLSFLNKFCKVGYDNFYFPFNLCESSVV